MFDKKLTLVIPTNEEAYKQFNNDKIIDFIFPGFKCFHYPERNLFVTQQIKFLRDLIAKEISDDGNKIIVVTQSDIIITELYLIMKISKFFSHGYNEKLFEFVKKDNEVMEFIRAFENAEDGLIQMKDVGIYMTHITSEDKPRYLSPIAYHDDVLQADPPCPNTEHYNQTRMITIFNTLLKEQYNLLKEEGEI